MHGNITTIAPRETDEFVPVGIKLNGQKITAGVEFAMTVGDDRPTVWVAGVISGGEVGFEVNPGAVPQILKLWIRVTIGSHKPVRGPLLYRLT
jgi:hypothetical protein